VIVPVRGDVDALAATLNPIVPAPEPWPDVTVNHAALLVAVQEQLAAALTPTLPVPPAAGTDWAAGTSEYEQAAPACVTVTDLPPAVIVPVREVESGFAAALRLMVPSPDPLAPAVTVSHALLLLAFQVQAEPAVIVTAAVPPAVGTD
jgi:hypothetical protein